MRMKGWLAAAALFATSMPACAQLRLPAPAALRTNAVPAFVPDFLGTLSLSLQNDPLFASRLLGSFDEHLRSVAPMRSPEGVARYLRARILQDPSGGGSLKTVAVRLGSVPMDADAASAVLLADALASPDSFKEVLSGMERIKPVWGQRIAHSMRKVERGSSPAFIEILNGLGLRSRPQPFPTTYGALGRLDGLFDGSR